MKKKENFGGKKSNESADPGNDDSTKLIDLLSRFMATYTISVSDSVKKSNAVTNPNQSIMPNSGMPTMRKFSIETLRLVSEGNSVIDVNGKSWN